MHAMLQPKKFTSLPKALLSSPSLGQDHYFNKSTELLEIHDLEGIWNKTDPETIKQIEASLDQFRNELGPRGRCRGGEK